MAIPKMLMNTKESILSISFESFFPLLFSINIDSPNAESAAIEKLVKIRMRLGKNVGRRGRGSLNNHLVNDESSVRKKEIRTAKAKK